MGISREQIEITPEIIRQNMLAIMSSRGTPMSVAELAGRIHQTTESEVKGILRDLIDEGRVKQVEGNGGGYMIDESHVARLAKRN